MASLKYSANSSLQTVTLGSGYTSGSGSMTLTTGHGARLPSSGDFWLAYDNGAGVVRLFKVTARSTDTLTVTADATEGSGDGNISSGETLRWALTAAALDQLKADIVAAGAMVLLETETASSSATLEFTTAITSTYDSYVFDFVNVLPATDNVTFHMRVSTDGGSSWLSTSIYQYANFIHKSSSSGAGGSTGTTSFNLLFNNVDADTAKPGVVGKLDLYAPGSSVNKFLKGQFAHYGENSGAFLGAMFAGWVATTSAINAVQFYFSSGNIASGVIRCYGIAK
jgi:hypothetical protein